jgi:hypothetical protein
VDSGIHHYRNEDKPQLEGSEGLGGGYENNNAL